MAKEPIIYQEQQRTYLIVVAVFILVAILLLVIVLFPGLLSLRPFSAPAKIVLLLVATVDMILFWSFSKLTIKLTDQHLTLTFGFFKKKISLTEIKNCQIEDYQKSIYFGYGIRLGSDKSIGYIARAGRGIKLKLKAKDYFFSTDRPEQLLLLLNHRP